MHQPIIELHLTRNELLQLPQQSTKMASHIR
jgi:hypothetical protein